MAATSPTPLPPLPSAAVPVSVPSSLSVPTPALAEPRLALPTATSREAPGVAPTSRNELLSLPTYRGVGTAAPVASRDEPEEALLSLLRLPQDAALALQICLAAWLPNGAFALAMLTKARPGQDVVLAHTAFRPTARI